ncbi:MAG: hypothetical protein IJ685_11435 [Selenomonadaceae bacterium]|nr:hypothetical protein [Selenomonadaceae bacterium]
MRKIFLSIIALIILTVSTVALANPISGDGYFKGIKLCGRVKVVTAFPDIKVQIVDAFADLKVKKVSTFPNKVGEWQFVTSGADFTIQFVDAFPDIKIKFVDAFPGL